MAISRNNIRIVQIKQIDTDKTKQTEWFHIELIIEQLHKEIRLLSGLLMLKIILSEFNNNLC